MRRAQAAPTGRLVVIDDDPLVLEGMSGLLRSWGYQVVVAATEEAALARLTENDQRPDLIICDYRLAEGESGLDVIERLREVFDVPALLITGDAALDRRDAARASRYSLLHKPIDAMALRAMIRQMLNK